MLVVATGTGDCLASSFNVLMNDVHMFRQFVLIEACSFCTLNSVSTSVVHYNLACIWPSLDNTLLSANLATSLPISLAFDICRFT